MKLTILCILSISLLGWFMPQTAHAKTIESPRLLVEVNDYRQQQGEDVLSEDSRLNRAAERKLRHMEAEQYWAHYGPDGESPWEFIDAQGYDHQRAGENLAIGFRAEEDLVAAWVESPEHRKVLDGDYTHVGFATGEVVIGERSGILVVAMFAEPKDPIASFAASQLDTITTRMRQSLEHAQYAHLPILPLRYVFGR